MWISEQFPAYPGLMACHTWAWAIIASPGLEKALQTRQSELEASSLGPQELERAYRSANAA